MGAGASIPAPSQEGVDSNNRHRKTGDAGAAGEDEAGVATTATFRCQMKGPETTDLPTCECTLSIGKESLLLRHAAPPGNIIRDVPFHYIVCWGYNHNAIEIRFFATLFGIQADSNDTKTVDVLFPTTEGAQIAVSLFQAVQKLKYAIDGHSLSPEDFDTLLTVLREDKIRGNQKEIQVLKSFGGARQIQGSQAVQVLKALSHLSSFDRLEAACVLHERLLNKNETAYLLFEQLADNDEKENLRHRLGLKSIPSS